MKIATKLVMHYLDGSSSVLWKADTEVKVQEPQREFNFDAFSKDNIKSLFDYQHYKTRGTITICRGEFRGCNVLSQEQIIVYFGSIERFINWCKYQVKPEVIAKLNYSSSDTQKDIYLMKKMIAKYEHTKRSK